MRAMRATPSSRGFRLDGSPVLASVERQKGGHEMASHWVGTWSATPAPADGVALSSPTIRMFPRISIGGDTIRVRLSNAAGTGDLVIASTHVARRGPGPSIRPDSDRVVTFNGSGRVKIPAGAFAISDPVSLAVA